MLLDREYKVPSKTNSKINLKVVPGHFATTSSHINFYMDMTTLKVRQKEAYEVAREMAKEYQYSKPIDTIVCTKPHQPCIVLKKTKHSTIG